MTQETPGDYLRRTLKDKDAMLEVAKLAAEDQRKAMTQNTREVGEVVAAFMLKHASPGYVKDGKKVYFAKWAKIEKDLTEILLHQLQKARHDWLREEMVRLATQQPKWWFERGDKWNATRWGYEQAIQTIIDRYQKELDQAPNDYPANTQV